MLPYPRQRARCRSSLRLPFSPERLQTARGSDSRPFRLPPPLPHPHKVSPNRCLQPRSRTVAHGAETNGAKFVNPGAHPCNRAAAAAPPRDSHATALSARRPSAPPTRTELEPVEEPRPGGRNGRRGDSERVGGRNPPSDTEFARGPRVIAPLSMLGRCPLACGGKPFHQHRRDDLQASTDLPPQGITCARARLQSNRLHGCLLMHGSEAADLGPAISE